MSENGKNHTREDYPGIIWGRKWSLIALIIICLFLGLAVCRYLVLKPDRLIIPENVEHEI